MRQHRTSNIEHRTPKEKTNAAWVLNESVSRKYDLEERLLEFASAVIDLSEKPPSSRAGKHVAGQMLRSGTSADPNHGEAESAESRDDFVHKFKICLKELRETRRWARRVQRKSWVENGSPLAFVLSESEELIRIFMSSIRTAEQNALKQRRSIASSIHYSSGGAG